jgi:hypothetical protein
MSLPEAQLCYFGLHAHQLRRLAAHRSTDPRQKIEQVGAL